MLLLMRGYKYDSIIIREHSQTNTQILMPWSRRVIAKQYEANQGNTGMDLSLLMKALSKGNLIHRLQLRLGVPCHDQLSAPSLMFSNVDPELTQQTVGEIIPVSQPLCSNTEIHLL